MDIYASSSWLKSLENRNSKWLDITRILYEINSPLINNKPVTFDEDPEPASDIEIEELLGIKRGDTVSSL